jgi:glycosyltransferase involved in cell wall biosynthesis
VGEINPLVSVIIPAYNATRFLPDAIASIRRQQYAPLEILIVDDGSEDGCELVAAELGESVRYVRQQRAGPAAARNLGLALARGEFIGFLDADDEWPEQKLSIQLARLLAQPELDVVLGRVRYAALEGGKIPNFRYEGPEPVLSNVHLGSGLYRRRAFDSVGGFDASLQYCEDVDWFLRARESRLRLLILRPVTLIYRLHGGNMTVNRELADGFLPVALKRSIERRRNMGAAGAEPLARWSSYDEWWPGRPPLVSVIVPVFNGVKFVDEAIGSILNQTYQPIEIIAVDDGSEDGTWEALGRFGPQIRRVRQVHAGQSAARNRGVELATGRYLAFLDADDLWPRDKLAGQVAILQEDTECSLLFGHAEQFHESGGEPSAPLPAPHPGTLLARREAWERVGPLRTDVRVGEFVDWLFRAREAGLQERMDRRVWLRRRIHGNNLGVRQRDAHGDYLRVLKEGLDRQRNQAAINGSK